MRHYGTADFLGDVPLDELIGPAISAFEMNNNSFHAASRHTVRVFEVLRDWIDEVGAKVDFEVRPSKVVTGESGEFRFAGERAGWLHWDGSTGDHD